MRRSFQTILAKMKNYVAADWLRLYSFGLKKVQIKNTQQTAEFRSWLDYGLVDLANEFVEENNSGVFLFMMKMNRIFQTERFDLLLKKWIVEYLSRLYNVLFDICFNTSALPETLILEDNSLHRLAVERYSSKFGIKPPIRWMPRANWLNRALAVLVQPFIVLHLSLNSGLRITGPDKKKYKVMREALWGLHGTRGYFFHDDFFVNDNQIKEDKLLLFSRETMKNEEGRRKAYEDARKSKYTHFYLPSLKMGLKPLLLRIIPKYVVASSFALLGELGSSHFSLFQNIFMYFAQFALPYEKVFSNYRVSSELGHNFFSANHIPEAIVFEHYGAKYYLMNWSDVSIGIDRYLLSFLGFDRVLLWGPSQYHGVEGSADKMEYIGYVFKRFVQWVAINRENVLSDMKINPKGKIATFFDESIGGECLMTEDHYVTFWETALKLAQAEKKHTVVMKPKILHRYESFTERSKERFLAIKAEMEALENIYILDPEKWSFIEAIGIADLVITQGMTSSSTIALICGVEALYLDEVRYEHPLARLFKDQVVFDDPQKLLAKARDILTGRASVLKVIPEQVMREYDEYPDDRGIDLLRRVLVSESAV